MIDVIIVNYCTAPFVVACLDSLEVERHTMPGLRAIVVDNASGDDSRNMLQTIISERGWGWVTLLLAPDNRGFGAGNNYAIDWALARPGPADVIWLLNPDTEVYPGAGNALVRFLDTCPAAGIAGSALLEADGQLWPFAFRFPSILGEIERGARWKVMSRLLRRNAVMLQMGKQCEKVDWVSGASFAIRRQLLEAGLRFDEEYFLYYEETDFCLRAKKMGWECWYVPHATVLHIAGQSTGVTGKRMTLRRLPAYWFHSRRRYFLKNHGRLYGMLADLGWLAGHGLARSKQRVSHQPDPDPPRLLWDFLRHSAFLFGR